MAVYGYSRVSTAKQDLGSQIEILEGSGCSAIYSEKYSGANRNRVQLNELLEVITEGDTVKVHKIDRLARSISDLKAITDEINAKGATLIFIENGLTFSPNTTDPMSSLMLNVLGSFAEFERDLIVNRTQLGKAYSKKHNKNFKDGRPKATMTPAKRHAYDLLMSGLSYTEVAKITEFSKSTLQRIRKLGNETLAAAE